MSESNSLTAGGVEGTVIWVQTILDSGYLKSGPGLASVTCRPPLTSSPPWADAVQPYATQPPSTGFSDRPGVNLTFLQLNGYTSLTGWLDLFDTYVLWQPTINGTTTYPVPLWVTFWTARGQATLNGTWQGGGAVTFSPSTQRPNYPTWNDVVLEGAVYTCK